MNALGPLKGASPGQQKGTVFSYEDALCYERIALRRGITLEGLARTPADLDVVLRAALFFAAGGSGAMRAEALTQALDVFLRTHADWLRASPEAFEYALTAAGLVCRRNEVVFPARVQSTLGTEEVIALWRDLARQRAERKAQVRAQLQAKNRRINAPKIPAPDPTFDEAMMAEALSEAHKALAAGEVPVGAVVVREGVVLARASNAVIGRHDPTAHAEILAIREAARALGNERLTGATLYVTLEPCAMCAAAVAHARIERVVWGADDPRAGGMGGRADVALAAGMNHRARTTAGVLRCSCENLLNDFFRQKRVAAQPPSKEAA
ncbi:MAG: tRNA adenosine(34) deaminase TadA [Duodenibacillus sp.]